MLRHIALVQPVKSINGNLYTVGIENHTLWTIILSADTVWNILYPVAVLLPSVTAEMVGTFVTYKPAMPDVQHLRNKKCRTKHLPPLPGPWLKLLGMINSFSGNHFYFQGHYVLDLWLQNQIGSSTSHDQLHVKFKGLIINSFRDNQ